MARSGNRLSRRLNRNNRAVQKMLRGKRKGKQPTAAVDPKTKPRRGSAKGKRIRVREMSEQHRQRISAGLKKYWRAKRQRRPRAREPLTNTAASIGTRPAANPGGKRGF